MSTAATPSETMDEGQVNDQPGRLPRAAKKPMGSSAMRPIPTLVDIILFFFFLQQLYDNPNFHSYKWLLKLLIQNIFILSNHVPSAVTATHGEQ